MNFSYYKETELEKWINDIYKNNEIFSPQDMDIHVIAQRLGIDIIYDNCQPFSHAGKYVIFLNKKSREAESRVAFFHELCHLLRHVGDQRDMPELFKEGQEIEAEHFALYAALPFFMISSLEVPEKNDLAVTFLAKEFKVPRELVAKRLKQVERRIVQSKLDESLHMLSQPKFEDSAEDESEIKFYTYYDYSDDVSGPSQLIVEVSEGIIESCTEVFIDIDGPFECMEDEDASRFNFTSLCAQDIFYRNGKIGINFAVLKLKYGRLSKRLVLQMRHIEELVNF